MKEVVNQPDQSNEEQEHYAYLSDSDQEDEKRDDGPEDFLLEGDFPIRLDYIRKEAHNGLDEPEETKTHLVLFLRTTTLISVLFELYYL